VARLPLQRLGADHDARHIAHVDGSAITRRDQEQADVGNTAQGLARRHSNALVAVADATCRERAVRVAHLGNQFGERDAIEGKTLGIGLHADLIRATADDIGQPNVIELRRARRHIGMFMSILLLVSAVIIALITYINTMKKIRQIATLKLIGAPDRVIVGMIVQQALALGFTGFFSGTILILAIKDYFPRRVVLEPDDALMLVGIVHVVCIAASGLGVRTALRVDPATALGG
jgi:hypothetical protein